MVDINGIAIYRCLKADQTYEQLGIFDADEIEADENDTVRAVAASLIENLIDDPGIGDRQRTPDYGNSKSARIHAYRPDAEVERENGYVTKTVLEELRNGTNLEANARAIAEWYVTETQSRSDLLLVVPYTYDGERFVGIIKTPYLDDAYQTDPSAILKEAQQIIQEKTHKGIIHPRYDRTVGRTVTDEAKVYQSGGGGNYADYWVAFLKLAETQLEDEELVDAVADGSGPVAELESTAEFADLPDQVDDDGVLDGRLKIEIAGIPLDVEVGDLADERVRLAKKGGTYFVIFTGGELDVEATDGQDRQELPELTEFEELETALAEYL